ncbi:hypothetical protein [Chryseobacterium sp. SG20098]|uniref:hypothetical protein n=1 Tax=Chryseobacterium sp. SG20098 TaxID=3074145 RepID=UPI002882EF2D|nr:hypothetical protein [Chryseobacterium sp. SG20098]WNI39132.1 hypothetical protein RHP76_11650 [Chryseobacterium sp. SG20098]
MNNQLYLILFWMLAFCGMPVSSLYQDKKVSVISAEKSEWIGGRAGVRGAVYIVKLKKNNNSVITVKAFRAEGNTIPFVQNNSGSTIIIRGNLPYKNGVDTKTADQMQAGVPVENSVPQKLNPKDNWIEYTVQGSQVPYKINISKFTFVVSSEEPAP